MIFDTDTVLFQGVFVTEQDCIDFGSVLANILNSGDMLAIRGDLGVGKTRLCRAIIQALVGYAEDVPSPTFTLVQQYDSPRGPVHHFDFYRLEKPEDVLELDIESAFYDGISLMEWPDKMGPYLPMDCLNITLSYNDQADQPDGREIKLTGPDSWRQRIGAVIQGQ